VRAFRIWGTTPISTGCGNEPLWNPEPAKRELFYRNGDDMMAAKISDQGPVEGKPERLFVGSYLAQSSYAPQRRRVSRWFVPDARKMPWSRNSRSDRSRVGWAEQLKRLLPSKNQVNDLRSGERSRQIVATRRKPLILKDARHESKWRRPA
jgi:hypothetical protein